VLPTGAVFASGSSPLEFKNPIFFSFAFFNTLCFLIPALKIEHQNAGFQKENEVKK
jgi:hypothetical protein